MTDLPPDASDACRYGLRMWIEDGFKIVKWASWQWQQIRLTEPDRAARLWLVVALATSWLVSVGGEANVALSESGFAALTPGFPSQPRQRRATRQLRVGGFRHGRVCVLAELLEHQPLPAGQFFHEP